MALSDLWRRESADVYVCHPSSLLRLVVFRSKAKGKWFVRVNEVLVPFTGGWARRADAQEAVQHWARCKLIETLHWMENVTP